jgi:hypothetical protein
MGRSLRTLKVRVTVNIQHYAEGSQSAGGPLLTPLNIQHPTFNEKFAPSADRRSGLQYAGRAAHRSRVRGTRRVALGGAQRQRRRRLATTCERRVIQKLLWACAIGTPKPTPSRAQPFAVRPLAKRSFRIRRLLRVARGRCLLFEGNIFGGHLRFAPILPQSRHQDDSLFHPSTARSENAFWRNAPSVTPKRCCSASQLLSFSGSTGIGAASPIRRRRKLLP